MKKDYFFAILFLSFLSLASFDTKAQNNVGIGTNVPDPFALVDMVINPAIPKGLLIPRMDSTTRQSIPVTAAQNGLMVYDTDFDCVFFYDSKYTKNAGWLNMCSWDTLGGNNGGGGGGGDTSFACSIATASISVGSAGNTSGLVTVTDSCGRVVTSATAAWITTGNYNTTAGTNYIGTNDNADFVFKTNGVAATNERMRIKASGRAGININPTTSAVLSVFANSSGGISSTIGDTAIYAYAFGSRTGVLGVTTSGYGLYGRSQISSSGIGVRGISTGGGTGVYAASNLGGAAVKARTTENGIAVDAQSGTGHAVQAISTSGSGNGVLASASNSSIGFGIWGVQNGSNNGTGIAGEGGDLTTTYSLGLSTGGVFNGKRFGVYGYAYSGPTNLPTAGGYFRDSLSAVIDVSSYVATYQNGPSGLTSYGILSTGVKSTIVKDLDDSQVVMYCPEAPEVLFEDYGKGQLVNGFAQIQLDEIFTKNVTINDNHPLRVFIQLEGDCNGVYVTEKSAQGFVVKELANGKSNVNFTYHIVANRADDYVNGELVSKYADLRFPKFEGFPKNARAMKATFTSPASESNNNEAK